MQSEETSLPLSLDQHEAAPRKAWHTPAIEDADVAALTCGGGTSGIEGTPFLKIGS